MKNKYLLVIAFSVVLGGCSIKDTWEMGISEDKGQNPKIFTEKVGNDIEVLAAETNIDRSEDDWLEKYCIRRIEELGTLPGTYDRKRGPFITFEPIYLPVRHSMFTNKATCTLDYYIWPTREMAFSNMAVDYAYSQVSWNKYHESVGDLIAGRLGDIGWKELMNEGDVGIKPQLSYSFNNSADKLREYMDVFFTKDEEVVFELLVVDTSSR